MEQIYSEKSVMRWLRQCCFLPFFQQTWLNSTSKQRLQHAIEQAEQQHHGEIVLIHSLSARLSCPCGRFIWVVSNLGY